MNTTEPKDLNIAERAERAQNYFRAGYNCAQSVYMAYADLFGMDTDLAAKVSAPLGGGMGRLREVCGACSGMFLVAGLAIPANNPQDKAAKAANYKMVQDLAADFRAENGSIICRELLGLDHKSDAPTPEPRTDDYYKKRPCVELVRIAAQIVGEKLHHLQIDEKNATFANGY